MTFDNSFLKMIVIENMIITLFHICVYPRWCQRSQVTKGIQFIGGARRKNQAEVREPGVSASRGGKQTLFKRRVKGENAPFPFLTVCCHYRAPLRKNSNKGKKWKEKEKEASRLSPGSRYGWVIKNTGVSVHLNFLTPCHC